MKANKVKISLRALAMPVATTVCFLLFVYIVRATHVSNQETWEAMRRNAEINAAARKQTAIDIQTLVGKKIVSISGTDKPCVITCEDGSAITFDCAKYSLKVKFTKPSDEAP